jgi:hypothetical protein
MMSDSLFSDAGWFFFAVWSVVVGAISVTAFGRDLLPSKARVESRRLAVPQTKEHHSECVAH